MRALFCVLVAATMGSGAALAEPEDQRSTAVTDEQIRSGSIIDDGLDIPPIRPGTQYFEIHGSTLIARALGDRWLPTDDAGANGREEDRQAADQQAAAW